MPLARINRMILFTDGVLEAENQQGEPFFEKRLMEIIASKSGDPLEDLLDGILSSVLDFSRDAALRRRRLPARRGPVVLTGDSSFRPTTHKANGRLVHSRGRDVPAP